MKEYIIYLSTYFIQPNVFAFIQLFREKKTFLYKLKAFIASDKEHSINVIENGFLYTIHEYIRYASA